MISLKNSSHVWPLRTTYHLQQEIRKKQENPLSKPKAFFFIFAELKTRSMKFHFALLIGLAIVATLKRLTACSCWFDYLLFSVSKMNQLLEQLHPSRCRKRRNMNQKWRQQRQSPRSHSLPAVIDALADTSRPTPRPLCRTTTRKPSKIQHRSLSNDQTDSRSDKTTESTAMPSRSPAAAREREKLDLSYL